MCPDTCAKQGTTVKDLRYIRGTSVGMWLSALEVAEPRLTEEMAVMPVRSTCARRGTGIRWQECGVPVCGAQISGENDHCLGQREAVEGQVPQCAWRCMGSQRPPASGKLEGPLLLLWGWPGDKLDTCPRGGALEVTRVANDKGMGGGAGVAVIPGAPGCL